MDEKKAVKATTDLQEGLEGCHRRQSGRFLNSGAGYISPAAPNYIFSTIFELFILSCFVLYAIKKVIIF